jgi:hypothetical protein
MGSPKRALRSAIREGVTFCDRENPIAWHNPDGISSSNHTRLQYREIHASKTTLYHHFGRLPKAHYGIEFKTRLTRRFDPKPNRSDVDVITEPELGFEQTLKH